MRYLFSLTVASLTIAPLLACGDSSGTGGNTAGPGTSGPSTTSTGGGGPMGSGDCNSTADCTPDGTCIALTPGGFRVCQYPIVEATMCNGLGGGGTGGGGGGQPAPTDECCTSDECNEICVVAPVFQQCGGPVGGPVFNVCTDDECDTAQDCDGNLCVAAGTIGNKTRQCLTTKCGGDDECTDEAGGTCQLVSNPCCDIPRGLFCVYPTGGCRKNADCGAGNFCDVMGTDAKCVAGAPTCPL